MKAILFCQFLFLSLAVSAQERPEVSIQQSAATQDTDWLVSPIRQKASIELSADKSTLILSNGLLRRVFTLKPGFACIDFKNLSSGQQLLRSIKPESIITVDEKRYNVGGLYGQKENAYLQKSWIAKLDTAAADFRLDRYTITSIPNFLHWKAKTWSPVNKPASGKMLNLVFRSSLKQLARITVTVHYELYDGMPLIVKWMSILNESGRSVKVDRVVAENLGIVEEESAVVGSEEQMGKQHGIYVETNYAFNNAMRYDISDQTMHWLKDTTYTSQVNYNYQTPCLLQVYPDHAPGIELKDGDSLAFLRVHELLIDSYDRERRGMMIQRMYRTVAPWTTQNPIFMHVVSQNDAEVYQAIDQCATTGYEALILSFGSHCDMEDSSSVNLARWKSIADSAHRRGILIGGYSLFSSRHISDTDDVINPNTGKPGGAFFGNAPCFGSSWGLAYRDKIKSFFNATHFDIWENDGPYPGDICASTTHPGHKNKDDSQWRQVEIQKELYHWLNQRGVYINSPDWYFLDGTNKTAVGYREVNFSLPRDQQKILNRQNIFDGTWEKLPSMGWGFVPLTKYQGGDSSAVLEPLSEHLADYHQLMMQYYSAGVQACYRGPRLFDTEKTKDEVKQVIGWYKAHRAILNSIILHLRRADGSDWDGWMHVNPDLPEKALVIIFNPLPQKITRTIKIPLYYAGLTHHATVTVGGGKPLVKKLSASSSMDITITIDPGDYLWMSIR